jgi:WD40 repeat protein
VPLGNYTFNTFLDIVVVDRYSYISTTRGTVFRVNLSDISLECIYTIHKNAVNSIDSTGQHFVTGSADSFVRVWPADFSDYFLEAQHSSPVLKAKISPDHDRALLLTQNGLVGTLDIKQHNFRALQRCYTANITSFASGQQYGEFAMVI